MVGEIVKLTEVKLKDVIISANTGADAIQRAPIVDYNTGIKCLRIGDISNKRKYNDWGYTNVNENNYKRYKLRKGNIIIARTGSTVGINKYIERDYNSVYNNGLIRLVIDETKYNSRFIYYIIQMKEFRNYINGIAFGTTGQPNIQINDLLNFRFSDITLEKQNKIVNILENIDKKIELNNQINDNLHNIGLIFYKKWINCLVDNNETTYKKIKELGKIVMGQSPKGESYNNDNIGLPLINGASDYENGYLKAQKYTSMPTKTCNKNDLIFCIRATIGLLTICDQKYCLGRGVASITDIDDNYKEYAYYLINNSIEEFKKLATGSVIVGINKDDIGNIKVKLPTDKQIESFHNLQKPIFEKINNIRLENKNLVNIRDALLPKLMNGEIELDKVDI